MSIHLTRMSRPGVSGLRRHVAGLFEPLECGCIGGGAIDGTCLECGAPSYL